MLHAEDNGAFWSACENGHLKVSQWLMGLCQTAEERIEMLHAVDFDGRSAFYYACERGHLEIAKWLWGLCQTAEEKVEMLHAHDDIVFSEACKKGDIEKANWLWDLCQTPEEQPTMLHADDDCAFREACEYGHQDVAEWLWKVCPDDQKPEMLHADDDCAFREACEYGHQDVAEWLFDLYETDARLRIYKKYVAIPLLWHKLYVYEQLSIINEDVFKEWLITTIKSNKSTKDVESLISATQSDDVQGVMKKSLYMLRFINVIVALDEIMSSSDVYHNYFKSCKAFNQHYFINHQLDEVVKIAIKAKNPDSLTNVLNGLEPMDLLKKQKLQGWLSLAKQEGNTVFQDIYISAVWRGDLYQVLEKDNNATHYDSLCPVIRVLFKHGIRLPVLMNRVIQDEQAGGGEWWCSIFQGVIISMLTEDPTSIRDYKCLIESFCEYPLVRYDNEVVSNEETEYQERCLTIITWFEFEFQKAENGRSKWTKDELWRMFQQLSLGSGIIMSDDHVKCINKLALFKQNLKLEIDAKRAQDLDVCSVMDGVDFDTHSGYEPDLTSVSFYQGKIKRKAPSGLADNQDQAGKKQRREYSAAGPSKS